MVRLTDHLHMTIVVDWDVKPKNKQTKKQKTKVLVELTLDTKKFNPFSNIILKMDNMSPNAAMINPSDD